MVHFNGVGEVGEFIVLGSPRQQQLRFKSVQNTLNVRWGSARQVHV